MVKKYNGELAPKTFKGQLKEESVFFQVRRFLVQRTDHIACVVPSCI
ncbi:hypothetical protein OESDEN_17690 [Oesophagostomum dentatum]|uniref:Uncharacterized protein n=1 Tax=Oesophagostomum dentatum TaxID=61180 RepID=A0A0B1SFG4_OESDE|nr:hypothetical protein OESDEN_17690 [Oesophagostomum dentatum]